MSRAAVPQAGVKNQVDGLPPAPSSGADVLARRLIYDYLWRGGSRSERNGNLTIELRNEGHSHVQGVLAHRLVLRVCLGKFWMARTAGG